MADLILRRPSYPIADVTALLSMSRSAIYRLIQRGELTSVKLGNRRRVNRAELLRFIEKFGLEVDPRLVDGDAA